MGKIKKSYVVNIVKFTQGTYARIGHYKVYEHYEQQEHMRDITSLVARECKYRLDKNGCISIKQGGRDGRKMLEADIYSHYGYDGVMVFIIGDR